MQGRLRELPERTERIAEIATKYGARPEGTLVISPDNASCVELNQAIRGELKEHGNVQRRDTEFCVPVPRSELSSEDRKWAGR